MALLEPVEQRQPVGQHLQRAAQHHWPPAGQLKRHLVDAMLRADVMLQVAHFQLAVAMLQVAQRAPEPLAQPVRFNIAPQK